MTKKIRKAARKFTWGCKCIFLLLLVDAIFFVVNKSRISSRIKLLVLSVKLLSFLTKMLE